MIWISAWLTPDLNKFSLTAMLFQWKIIMNQPNENIAFNFLILGKLIYKFFLQLSIRNELLLRVDLH